MSGGTCREQRSTGASDSSMCGSNCASRPERACSSSREISRGKGNFPLASIPAADISRSHSFYSSVMPDDSGGETAGNRLRSANQEQQVAGTKGKHRNQKPSPRVIPATIDRDLDPSKRPPTGRLGNADLGLSASYLAAHGVPRGPRKKNLNKWTDDKTNGKERPLRDRADVQLVKKQPLRDSAGLQLAKEQCQQQAGRTEKEDRLRQSAPRRVDSLKGAALEQNRELDVPIAVQRQAAITQSVLGSSAVAVHRVQRQDHRITVSTQRKTLVILWMPMLSRMEQGNQARLGSTGGGRQWQFH